MMQVAMLATEVALFQNFLRQARSYFEFGTGGSTVLAASTVNGPVSAVDSSQEWLSKVEAALPKSEHVRHLIYADVGPVGDWGTPIDHSNPDKFLNYHETVWQHIDEPADLYLVDGRFRVACFCQVIMRMPRDSIVGMHDYRSREYYHPVEAFARPIAEVDDLTFFVKRRGISYYEIARILNAHKHNWN